MFSANNRTLHPFTTLKDHVAWTKSNNDPARSPSAPCWLSSLNEAECLFLPSSWTKPPDDIRFVFSAVYSMYHSIITSIPYPKYELHKYCRSYPLSLRSVSAQLFPKTFQVYHEQKLMFIPSHISYHQIQPLILLLLHSPHLPILVWFRPWRYFALQSRPS